MSGETSALDDDAAMLARLAALDLAAAERVHERLMAAEEPDQITSLSRAYRGLSRSLRQTLILKGKHRDAVQRRDQQAHAEAVSAAGKRLDAAEAPLWTHHAKAVAVVAKLLTRERLEIEDPERLEDEAHDLIAEWVHEDGFLDAQPLAIARMACDRLGLPMPETQDAEPPSFQAPSRSASSPNGGAPDPDHPWPNSS